MAPSRAMNSASVALPTPIIPSPPAAATAPASSPPDTRAIGAWTIGWRRPQPRVMADRSTAGASARRCLGGHAPRHEVALAHEHEGEHGADHRGYGAHDQDVVERCDERVRRTAEEARPPLGRHLLHHLLQPAARDPSRDLVDVRSAGRADDDRRDLVLDL